MMRTRIFRLLALIAVLSVAAGCTWIRTSADLENGLAELEPETPDEKVEPDRGLLPAKDAIAAVELRMQKADGHIRAGEYEKARGQYERALRILLDRVDPSGRDEYRAQLDQAFLRLTVAYTRVSRLRGVMLPRENRGGDIAIAYNQRVDKWVNYYLSNGRGSMEKYLERSGAYFEMIDGVLTERGLPGDLKYLPIIESGFSPYAYSPAAASGLWQFIPSTGRRFGLRIDQWVDERRDPTKATGAAADYLTFLYGMFNDWALALAAYNCGEACVARAIQNSGSHNFWELSLPAETMDYVPKYMAATIIARDPETYGFYVDPDPPMKIRHVRIDGVASLRELADKTNVDFDELKRWNPELLGPTTPAVDSAYELNIPLVFADQFEQSLQSLGAAAFLAPDEVKKLTAPKPPAGSGSKKVIYYTVKKGDSLGKIARRYKTTVTAIKRLNRMKGNNLRAGQKIKVQPGAKK